MLNNTPSWPVEKSEKIFVAGHRGLVGSALVRKLERDGFAGIVTRDRSELDLRNEENVARFFASGKARVWSSSRRQVGGSRRTTICRRVPAREPDMQNNVTRAAYDSGVRKLLFLGNSCIYPRHAPQPIPDRAAHRAVGPTNEAYAIAKNLRINFARPIPGTTEANFISAMPTTLGPNDNFVSLSSHVLPALLLKATCENEGKRELVVWVRASRADNFFTSTRPGRACVFLSDKLTPEIINVAAGRTFRP